MAEDATHPPRDAAVAARGARPGGGPEPRVRRGRSAKAPLSLEAIVEAALGVLMEDGLDAVSMRRVAAALDTGAASLYVYVPNREGLLQEMLAHVTSQMVLETPDPARWREQLHALLAQLHQLLVEHPGLAALTFGDPPTSGPVLAVAENMMATMLAGGLRVQDSAWAMDIFTMLVAAMVNEDDMRRRLSGGRPVDPREMAADVVQTFAALPPDRFPVLTGNLQAMVSGDGRERARFAIDLILDGMVARAVGPR